LAALKVRQLFTITKIHPHAEAPKSQKSYGCLKKKKKKHNRALLPHNKKTQKQQQAP